MLHPYATDSEERKTIPFYLAGFAILTAIPFSWLLAKLQWPGWLDAPAAMGFYSAYYELFKHVLWRKPLLQKWGGVKVPVLIGSWKGHVITSFDEKKGKHPIEATIVQNWTEIQISMKSAYSKSQSIVGSILISDDETVIDFEYKNEPMATAIGTMHAHRGTASLVLSADSRTLSGDYYSGRDRQNFGSLHLVKQKTADSARTKQK